MFGSLVRAIGLQSAAVGLVAIGCTVILVVVAEKIVAVVVMLVAANLLADNCSHNSF